MWNVTTVTGQQGSSGLLEDVILVLCGDCDETDQLHLHNKTKETFQPNSIDKFKVN